MSKYTDLRQAITLALNSIKIANGYSVEFPEGAYMSPLKAAEPTELYPRFQVLMSEFSSIPVVGRREEKEIIWLVVVTVVDNSESGGNDCETQLEEYIEAVERCVRNSGNFSGLVTEAYVRNAVTDANMHYPNGNAVIEILTRQDIQY